MEWLGDLPSSASTNGNKDVYAKGTQRERDSWDNKIYSSIKLGQAVVYQCIGYLFPDLVNSGTHCDSGHTQYIFSSSFTTTVKYFRCIEINFVYGFSLAF